MAKYEGQEVIVEQTSGGKNKTIRGQLLGTNGDTKDHNTSVIYYRVNDMDTALTRQYAWIVEVGEDLPEIKIRNGKHNRGFAQLVEHVNKLCKGL